MGQHTGAACFPVVLFALIIVIIIIFSIAQGRSTGVSGVTNLGV